MMDEKSPPPSAESQENGGDVDNSDQPQRKPSMESICTSSDLDQLLDSKELKVSYHVPKNLGVEHVSEKTTGMLLPNQELVAIGVMAGLGLKRKNSDKEDKSGKKAKTLQDKRQALEADMMRYGRETVEKMYPKQSRVQSKRYGTYGYHRHSSSAKSSPIKMRPKPSGLDFEEIDARKILRPFSHAKYIYEPAQDTVVYIARRNGLVPLSSLCKDSKTVLSSNVKLLQGRNIRLGKPGLYVRHKSRLLAIGGSRKKSNVDFKVVKVPKLKEEKKAVVDMTPFEVDGEMARFALEALVVPSKLPKVDIRTVKKHERMRSKGLEVTRPSQENIVEYMLKKIKRGSMDTIEEGDERSPSPRSEVQDDSRAADEQALVSDAVTSSEKESKKESLQQCPEQSNKDVQKPDGTSNGKDESSDEETEFNSSGKVYNEWSKEESPAINVNEIENRPIWTEAFRAKMEERKKLTIAGVDECDVEECFCKEEEQQQMLDQSGGDGLNSISAAATEAQTPISGAQTPSASAQEDSLKKGSERKTRTKLNKVRRALKTLGVNFYEFDDSAEGKDVPRMCSKDYCALGCVCDSISGKLVPPSHCGKVECMFKCFCSEDAVKFASSKKVGISPVGAANLRSTSQRNMAAEERKFHNTVVATSSGQDLFMLGSTGRHKRERKVPSRYQDSSSVAMNSVGHEFVDKSTSGDMNDYTKTDPVNEKMLAEGLRADLIQKCAVIVPYVVLPENTEPWCMYHCQHSCPCSRFKNPLDYGPDRNASGGGKQLGTVKKAAFMSRPRPNSVKVRELNHSARTAGFVFKPSNRVSMPHNIVSSSNSKPTYKPGPKSKQLQRLASMKLKEKKKKESAAKEEAKPVEQAPPEDTKASETPQFSLSMQTKGSIQYVGWNIMKRELHTGNINVFCFMRSSRPVVFVAKSTEAPYVTNAENIKNLHPSRFISLPPTIESLLTPTCEEDLTKYAILTHNGIAWEITGVLQKKKPKVDGEETPLTPKSLSPTKLLKPPPLAQIPTQQPVQSAHVIGADTKVMKLPQGQSLVTMQRQGHQTMQIKLPPTTPTQHWCTIRVDNVEGSIQCPDSTMALKCNVLKQAANLSMKEDTTVRIPIAVPGEVGSFGVYAVPGLSTHVFVGPFSQKCESTEIINLESPPPPSAPTAGKDDEDDIQVISSSVAGGRKVPTEGTGQIVGDLVDSISDRAVSMGERKKRRQVFKSRIVTGQVPQVVSGATEDAQEVITLDSDDDDNSDMTQAEALKESHKPKKVPYTNLPSSEHGKIVMQPEKRVPDGAASSSYFSLKGEMVEIKANIKLNGIVTFRHPDIQDHDVFCGSVEDANEWLKEYERGNRSIAKKEPAKAEGASKSSGKDHKPGQGLQLKPLSSLMPPLSYPASTSTRPRGNQRAIVSGTQEILHGDGKKGYAIFLNKQNQTELCKLFYDLGNEAFAEFFHKSMSKLQILQKAKEEAISLQEEAKELESTKKILIAKRQSLFEKFTNSLNGLPVHVKKQKLIDLKNLVKNKGYVPSNSNVSAQAQSAALKREAVPTQSIPQSLPPLHLQALQPHLPTAPAGPPSITTMPLTTPQQVMVQQQPVFSTVNSAMVQQDKIKISQLQSPALEQNVPGGSSGSAIPSALNTSGPTPYSDVTGLKTVKKDGKVLRPMNAFMLWAKDHRRTLIANGYDGATVSKMLADEWKILTDDQKQQYYHDAERLKNLHQLQHPDYKYCPRARKNTKKVRSPAASAPTSASPSSSSVAATAMGVIQAGPSNLVQQSFAMPAAPIHIQPKPIAPAPPPPLPRLTQLSTIPLRIPQHSAPTFVHAQQQQQQQQFLPQVLGGLVSNPAPVDLPATIVTASLPTPAIQVPTPLQLDPQRVAAIAAAAAAAGAAGTSPNQNRIIDTISID